MRSSTGTSISGNDIRGRHKIVSVKRLTVTYFLYRPTFQIIEATFVTNPNPVLAYPPQNIHANLLDLYPYM